MVAGPCIQRLECGHGCLDKSDGFLLRLRSAHLKLTVPSGRPRPTPYTKHDLTKLRAHPRALFDGSACASRPADGMLSTA